jgi:hypothetical protein
MKNIWRAFCMVVCALHIFDFDNRQLRHTFCRSPQALPASDYLHIKVFQTL